MKYYLAAHYPRIGEMQKVAKKLQALGHEITSRWVFGGEEGKTWTDIGEIDYLDVKAADIVLVFTGPFMLPSGQAVPGMLGVGHHIEYGLAYGLGKEVVVIGPFESPLHRFPLTRQFPTLNKYIKSLGGTPRV